MRPPRASASMLRAAKPFKCWSIAGSRSHSRRGRTPPRGRSAPAARPAVIAGPQALRIPVADMKPVRRAGIDRHKLPRHVGHTRAQRAQDVHQGVHVLNIGKVLDGARLVAQQRGGDHRHRRVFSAADAHLPLQGIAAGNQHSFFRGHGLRPCRTHLLAYAAPRAEKIKGQRIRPPRAIPFPLYTHKARYASGASPRFGKASAHIGRTARISPTQLSAITA